MAELSKQEKEVIHLYTVPEDEQEIEFSQKDVSLFISALKKLPNVSVTSYRGLFFYFPKKKQKFVEDVIKNEIWKNKNLMSTSKDLSWASMFTEGSMEGGLILVIEGKAGKDISNYAWEPEEHEIIFLPGSSFSVTKEGKINTENNMFDAIWLKEI